MDPIHQHELLDIYLAEVDERAERLVAAARALPRGPLDAARLQEAVRDAHTLKGSSHMMGRPDAGEAAAVLERSWKTIATSELESASEYAPALERVAAWLPRGARGSAGVGEIGTDLTILRSMGTPGAPLPAAAERPQTRLQQLRGGEGESLRERLDSPTSLGGLLESIEHEVMGGVTRVDTADLYRLINRAVEVGLDTEALVDLTHIKLDNADPTRLIEAWRSQLSQLARDVADLQRWAVSLANVSFRDAIETFPQFVRFLARRLGKDVRFEVSGDDIELDRQIVDMLREPLRHLLVNAVDHGIEPPDERAILGKPHTGVVSLRAQVLDDRLVVTVADDGRGIDWNAVREVARSRGLELADGQLNALLFSRGFSTLPTPGDFSGEGEGLAVVAEALDRVAGGIHIDSVPGQGTTVALSLPVSLVLQNVVIVVAGDQFWGIPEPSVRATLPLGAADIRHAEEGRQLRFNGELIPMISLTQALGVPRTEPETEALVLATRSGSVAVTVSEVVDRRRVAVKSLGPILDGSRHLTGAAFLGGGEIVVVVDHNYLGSRARRRDDGHDRRPRVLVVDDSAGVRQLIGATLSGRGFEVQVAGSAKEAVAAMADQSFDALVVDYSMPQSNGVELVRALRSAGVSLPIIMVSGVATPDDQAAAWEAGVDAYLDKFDLRQGALTASLRSLLHMRSEQEPAP